MPFGIGDLLGYQMHCECRFTIDAALADVASRKRYDAAALLKLAERLIPAIESSD